MSQRPHGEPQHPGHLPQQPNPTRPALHPQGEPPKASIGLGIIAVVWAGLGLVGHTIMTLYLALGAAMTHTLDGVFGDDPNGVFNFVVLLIALIGQLLGLALSVVALLLGIGAKRKRIRRSTAAMVLGIVATATFLLIGLIQLPIASLFFNVISL